MIGAHFAAILEFPNIPLQFWMAFEESRKHGCYSAAVGIGGGHARGIFNNSSSFENLRQFSFGNLAARSQASCEVHHIFPMRFEFCFVENLFRLT